jgi:hypothetical protein
MLGSLSWTVKRKSEFLDIERLSRLLCIIYRPLRHTLLSNSSVCKKQSSGILDELVTLAQYMENITFPMVLLGRYEYCSTDKIKIILELSVECTHRFSEASV